MYVDYLIILLDFLWKWYINQPATQVVQYSNPWRNTVQIKDTEAVAKGWKRHVVTPTTTKVAESGTQSLYECLVSKNPCI
jgi:hypothetical protein